MKKEIKKFVSFALVLLVTLTLVPMHITEAADKVQISKSTATIWVKNYVTLKMHGTTTAVTWKSSNTKVATVSSKGKVVGVKVGTATITATVGKKDYTCKVIVKQETSTKELDNLISDIKKNINSKSICKVLSDDDVTIPYSSIISYKLVDVNWDGIKDLLVWAQDVCGDGAYSSDAVRVITVKDKKAVIAGWCGILNPNREDDSKSIKFYLNKKTKNLVVLEHDLWIGLEGYRSLYMNNSVLYSRTSSVLSKENMDDNAALYYSAAGTISKEDFDAAIRKYYKSSDMTEIKFDMIAR